MRKTIPILVLYCNTVCISKGRGVAALQGCNDIDFRSDHNPPRHTIPVIHHSSYCGDTTYPYQSGLFDHFATSHQNVITLLPRLLPSVGRAAALPGRCAQTGCLSPPQSVARAPQPCQMHTTQCMKICRDRGCITELCPSIPYGWFLKDSCRAQSTLARGMHRGGA